MLKGENIQLRLVRESDLEAVYAGLNDISNRGAYFPANLHPESRLRAKIQDGGFWSADEGLLLIVDGTRRGRRAHRVLQAGGLPRRL